MKLGKFEDNLDSLRLVVARKAPVLPALKNPRAALVDEMRANRVLSLVEALVEAFLLGKEDDGTVVLRPASLLT